MCVCVKFYMYIYGFYPHEESWRVNIVFLMTALIFFIFRLFKKYKPIICHTTHDPLKDFVFMMSFNKIIQSASSFSWWASFLSKAEAIYTPAPFFGHWSGEYPGVDLTVDDEARYVYLSCQERYKKSIYEKCIEIKNRSILENIKILGNKVRHWIR